MHLRRYKSADCKEILALFYDTVHRVNAKDYTKEQLDAWATGGESESEWDRSFCSHYTVVAVCDKSGKIMGFGDIDGGYLDRLYVGSEFQGMHVGTAICDELEKHAISNGELTVTTHASITARGFFEKRGYAVTKERQVVRRGVALTNYEAVKKL